MIYNEFSCKTNMLTLYNGNESYFIIEFILSLDKQHYKKYQTLCKESDFADCMQFYINRFKEKGDLK